MTEERITETRDPMGNTHTTILRDNGEPPARGGGAKWFVLAILLVALIAGFWMFAQGNNAEIARDQSIGEAAEQVGDAASRVGNAVEDVANEVTDGE